ncbi:hypothetical protein PtB15_1B319 [Puccinia triticina]|nr:hypothetical protein PtB15_1B319 [Puccinia triticina]
MSVWSESRIWSPDTPWDHAIGLSSLHRCAHTPRSWRIQEGCPKGFHRGYLGVALLFLQIFKDQLFCARYRSPGTFHPQLPTAFQQLASLLLKLSSRPSRPNPKNKMLKLKYLILACVLILETYGLHERAVTTSPQNSRRAIQLSPRDYQKDDAKDYSAKDPKYSAPKPPPHKEKPEPPKYGNPKPPPPHDKPPPPPPPHHKPPPPPPHKPPPPPPHHKPPPPPHKPPPPPHKPPPPPPPHHKPPPPPPHQKPPPPPPHKPPPPPPPHDKPPPPPPHKPKDPKYGAPKPPPSPPPQKPKEPGYGHKKPPHKEEPDEDSHK